MEQEPSGTRSRPITAWVIGGSTWALALSSLILVVAAPTQFSAVPWYAERDFYLIYLVIAVTAGAGSAVILNRRSHPAGWITAAIALCFAWSEFALGWSLFGWRHDLPGIGTGIALAAGLSSAGAFLAMSVLPWLLRAESPRGFARGAAIIGTLGSVVIGLISLTYQQPDSPTNPFAPAASVLEVLAAVASPMLLLNSLVGLLGVGSVIRHWRREPPDRARAYGVMATAVTLLFGVAAALQFWPSAWHRATLEQALLALLVAAQLLLTLSVVVVILGPRRIAGAVPRAVVFGLLSSIVVGIYVACVTALGVLLPISDQSARTVMVAVVALLAHPLRRWLQDRVDRVVYGDAADPVRILAELGQGMQNQAAGLEAVLAKVRHGLRLGWLEVRSTEPPQVIAAAGRPLTEPRTAQRAEVVLKTDSRLLGTMRAQATVGQRLDERTLRALAQLSDVIALSLDLEQTRLRLRDASCRLGEVRHEERRMLRRDLHDGMGPALAGISLGLAAAGRRLRHDPEGAEQLLDDLRHEVNRRTEDVRLLARSLLPAQLDDADLHGALVVLAERFTNAGLCVDVAITTNRQLTTREQIAIYHVASEALMNAHRHARATRVEIAVSQSQDRTVLEIHDDGIGIAPAPRRGVGLTSMRERADALGAQLSVQAPTDRAGTRVRMELR
ncbi:sensor histidine kinase [Nocardioides sp. Bht2]|uniref:sensor histidine kinase n=1 Tax=Nocardioides sp. Bht2 TaxID=3392297 RepID=UPI0039B4BF4F